MAKALGVRALWAIPSLLIVTFLVFAILEFAPGDSARSIAGPEATQDAVDAVRERLGLAEPLPERYAAWVADAARGDLQESLVSGRPVTDVVFAALPASLSVSLLAFVFAIAFAFVVGVAPSIWRHWAVDRAATFVAALTIALPPFWIALLLVATFAVDLRWFPALGYAPMSDGFAEWLKHLVLPALSLAMFTAGELARQLRGALRDALQADYILAARAKGLSNTRVVLKHGLKNAAVPVVTVFGARVASLLGGTVVIESIFLIDGLGRLTVSSVLARDVPVVLGIVVVATCVVLVVNLVVDASYGYFNPRLRQR